MKFHLIFIYIIFKTIADQPKRRFTLGKLLLALLFLVIAAILGLVVVAYLPQNHRIKDTVLQTTFGFNIAMIVILMFIAIYYIYFRNKKRAVIGTLELKSTEIILNNQTFPISTIRHLRIVGNDRLCNQREQQSDFYRIDKWRPNFFFFYTNHNNKFKKRCRNIEKVPQIGHSYRIKSRYYFE